MTKIVESRDVKSSIDGKVRHLKKADLKPYVFLPNKQKASLLVTRRGNVEALPISRRVAEELIAAGFTYGN